jgi:hypothetical protein
MTYCHSVFRRFGELVEYFFLKVEGDCKKLMETDPHHHGLLLKNATNNKFVTDLNQLKGSLLTGLKDEIFLCSLRSCI